MGVWYATREDVKSALDSKETARNNAQVDRAVEGASRAVEQLLRRQTLAPTVATKYFDWPGTQYARYNRLWLDDNELVSLTSMTSGGVTIPPGNVFLGPANYGPPFDHIEINTSTSSVFGGGNTSQRNIAVTGVWGYDNVTAPAGALTASSINSSVTAITCTNSAVIGVGDVLTIDSEKMLVTEKTMVTTSTTLSGSSLAQKNDTVQVVSSGASHNIGETILLGSEKMLVVEISSNNLTVIRGWDGSALATHSGSTIFAPRTLTVVRGALGTTAASHNASATITKQVFPGLVKQLCVAEALNFLANEGSGYARSSGQGDSEQQFSGRSLDTLRAQAYAQLGRKTRHRAV